MKIECTLSIEYKNEVEAQTVLKSIQIDDLAFVHSTIAKNVLTATITATSLPSLIHTLDDYLACVNVASSVVDKS